MSERPGTVRREEPALFPRSDRAPRHRWYDRQLARRDLLRRRDRLVDHQYGRGSAGSGLDLDLDAGDFVAVLGSNGTGKTSLLKSVLGLQPLSAGSVTVAGEPARRGSDRTGYIPQERRIDPSFGLRARDLVGMGLDGRSWGPGLHPRRRRRRVDDALAAVGAQTLADRPVHRLSGGEQQRVRIAQALATDPVLLLCDEPLLSLDLSHQDAVVRLIDQRRREHGTAVLFVTHEINPVLRYVDKVLYLAQGQFRVGSVEEVMTSESLTALYGSPVEVIRSRGRILVAGTPLARPGSDLDTEVA